MAIELNLPPELESELNAEASRQGLSLSEYVTQALLMTRTPGVAPRSGTELVTYWRDEGLIGMRSDIADSQQHASILRQQAERRERP